MLSRGLRVREFHGESLKTELESLLGVSDSKLFFFFFKSFGYSLLSFIHFGFYSFYDVSLTHLFIGVRTPISLFTYFFGHSKM